MFGVKRYSRVTEAKLESTIGDMNLMTYVQRNQRSLKQQPCNVFDLVGFAWLTYCDYGERDGEWPLSFERLYRDPYYRDINAFKESFFPGKSRRFFALVSKSKRYKSAQILAHFSLHDVKKAIQFCALAIRFGENLIIAYEGTDISREGWEEDFMLSYRSSIPSYDLAMEFYEKVSQEYDGPIYLTGHSKGGNVAEYVLARVEDDSRIVGSYSFEGPGFRDPHFFDAYPSRVAKMHKYIPQGAFVGVIFEDKAETKVVKSNAVALLQHDPFSWAIEKDDFVYRKDVSRTSKISHATINGWVESLDDADKKRFASLFFDATTKMRVADYTQFFKVFPMKLPSLYAQYRHFSPEDKQFCRKIIRSLLDNVKAAMAKPKKQKQPVKKQKAPRKK